MKQKWDKAGFYIACICTGCLIGFGTGFFTGTSGIEFDTTKDNTLLREEYDGVFFREENEKPEDEATSETIRDEEKIAPSPEPEVPVISDTAPEAAITPGAAEAGVILTPGATGTETTMTPGTTGTEATMTPGATGAEGTMIPEQTATSLPTPTQEAKVTPASPRITIFPVLLPTPSAVPTEEPEDMPTFQYPSKIFGQTPVVNRNDRYVTYFEFAMDLIDAMLPEVRKQGKSEMALFARFTLKALVCGVDINDIEINQEISRSQAALALWLAADIMGEKGTDTSAKTAGVYVADIKGCSSSEKKAIAYLYEQGMEAGYQVQGRYFSPGGFLTEKDAKAWMKRAKECWK